MSWISVALGSSSLPELHQLSVEQLDALPGVGPDTALAIVVSIQEHGPFRSWEELEQLEGVGAGVLGAIRARTQLAPEHSAPIPDRTRPVVNPNLATPAMLTHWPGVSIHTGTRIVDYRDENGFFEHCTDLIRVPGIGPATVSNIGERCKITE